MQRTSVSLPFVVPQSRTELISQVDRSPKLHSYMQYKMTGPKFSLIRYQVTDIYEHVSAGTDCRWTFWVVMTQGRAPFPGRTGRKFAVYLHSREFVSRDPCTASPGTHGNLLS